MSSPTVVPWDDYDAADERAMRRVARGLRVPYHVAMGGPVPLRYRLARLVGIRGRWLGR